MKVLVCGGRDYENEPKVFHTLEAIEGKTAIIHGNARGADTFGKNYARNMGYKELCFPADWNKYGRKAGPIRNLQMLGEGKPDLVVAFGGGSGTNHMVSISKASGIEVIEVDR